jgi:hypothetical protein
MHAHRAVHQLGDRKIDGEAGEHVRFVGAEVLVGDEEVDGLAQLAGHALGLRGNRLKNSAHATEVIHVALCCALGNLVQMANGGGFQARLAGIVGWVDNFYFHLNRILTALHPAFALFSAFFHECHSRK